MAARTKIGRSVPSDRRWFRCLPRVGRLADQFAASAGAIDHDGAFPTTEFADLRRAGLLTAPLPIAQGGWSLGMTGNDPSSRGTTHVLLRILAEVGRGNLAVGRLYEGHINALLLIREFGTPDQLAAWAADVRAGALFGVWNTQAGDGLRLDDTATPGWVELRGTKTFGSGAGYLTRPLVTGALPDGGWQMAIIPADLVELQVDTSWWHPLGMKASASHRVDFTGIRIPAQECLLGAPGNYYQEPAFSGGAIRFAAVQLGGARALLDATVASLREFGRTDDPYQKTRIGAMAIAVESGRQWLQAAAEVTDQNADESDPVAVARTITHARMTRTALESIGQDVLRLAEQAVGARGLIRPHPIERIGRDLTLYLRQPGPDFALAEVGQTWLSGDPLTTRFDSRPEPAINAT